MPSFTVRQNDGNNIPMRASAIPEGVYAGFLLYLFFNLTVEPMQLYLVWINSLFACLALAYVLWAGVTIRDRWPWRWHRSLVYCVLVFCALILLNTGWSRWCIVFVYLAYSAIIYYRLRRPVPEST